MKGVFKILGVIALVAVIGFGMAACSGKSGGKTGGGVQGTSDSSGGGKAGVKVGGKSKPEDFGYWRNKENTGIRIFYYTGSGTDIVIPDSFEKLPVVEIYYKLFQENTDITSVSIPGTVKEIPEEAFKGCTRLKSVKLSNGLTKIGSGAFMECTSLTSIQIPEGITVIDNGTFSDCTALTEVQLPESLTTLNGAAFSGCKNLVKLNVPAALTNFPKYKSRYDDVEYSDIFGDSGKIPLATRDKLIAQGYPVGWGW